MLIRPAQPGGRDQFQCPACRQLVPFATHECDPELVAAYEERIRIARKTPLPPDDEVDDNF